MKASPRLTQLPTYVFAWLDDLKAKARARGADLIDLGMGNPDQEVPAPILEAIAEGVKKHENHGYPAFKGKATFRQAVTDWMQRRYGVSVDPETQVLALSGSKEGIAHISMAYMNEGDISLVPEIFYPVFSRATWLVGGQVYHLPMPVSQNFLADLSAIPEDVLKRARLLFLNYPNNPTGAVATLGYYQKAVDFCRQHDIVLVSDLAYGEINFDGHESPSVLQIPGAMDVTVEFHSFSKSFSMAGERLGFAVGNPDLIQALYSFRTNVGYGTPQAIQDGGTLALQKAEAFLPPTVQTYQRRRDVVVEGFRSLGWQVNPPQGGMYIWLRVPQGFTSEAWTQHLIDTTDVVVSPGHAFGQGGEGFFRVSLVSPEDTLKRAIERLAQKGIRYA